MKLLIGLLPALFWGLYPLWLKKRGGSYLQQVLGTGIGILIAASIIQIIYRYPITPMDFSLFFISGICWSIGQAGQVWSFQQISVSAIMPLTTAFQTIGNSLVGAWLFKEWTGLSDNLLGLMALVIILVGVFISNGMVKLHRKDAMVYLILLVTSAGFWGYSGFPHYSSVSGMAGFFPQAVGMFVGAMTIYLIGNKRVPGDDRWGLRNISSGFVFGGAAATYLISLSLNGLVNAFVLTQLNVVISTVVATVILKEKAKSEIPATLIGLVILIIGVFAMVRI